MKKEILVVDDEKDIRDVIFMILEKNDYNVTMAECGTEAVQLFLKGKDYDLVLLDIIMPKMDGVETAKKIREHSECPILFLTAKSSDEDKLHAYNAGGDDYLVKPFSRVELLLRVGALLKRYGKKEEESEQIRFNASRRIVMKNGSPVKLTEKEYELLYFLFQNRGVTYGVHELYEAVWNEKFMQSSSNTVMVHILNLRKKIEDDFTHPKYILTVWGKGYCYVEEKE